MGVVRFSYKTRMTSQSDAFLAVVCAVDMNPRFSSRTGTADRCTYGSKAAIMTNLRFDRLPLLIFLILLGAQVQAQTSENKPGAAEVKQVQQQIPATPPTTAVTQAAVQQGILNCAGRINQVTNFLGFNNQSGAMLMTPPNQPDLRLVPLAMEIPTESGSAYVSAHFAPNQANGCGAAYDAVVYWPQKCDTVASRQYAALKKVGQLKRDITVLDGGFATKVFLMPAGSGCVSIKKEVVL